MLDINDFTMRQIIVYEPKVGDKLSYKNDNIVIKDSEGKIKYQHTCYRIFAVIVIGDCSITTGLLRRAKKYGFSICFMTYGFRYYAIFNNGLEGNSLLRSKQYQYQGMDIGVNIIINKIENQRRALNHIRKKSEYIKEGIALLDDYTKQLRDAKDLSREHLLGIEGNAAKIYFQRMFANTNWKGRKPRVKFDYINSLLDIGYTVLFNFIDCILHIYDFDVYKGVLHTAFYMRKSLVCDLMEPFRPLIDMRVRKGINLGQFKESDFCLIQNQWQLEYKKSSEYTFYFMKDLLDNKECIFLYIRGYYRAFMKGKLPECFPQFNIEECKVIFLENEV